MSIQRRQGWIDSSVISLTVAMAAELRSPVPERVVEMARRLVAALDRQGMPIEELVARSFIAPAISVPKPMMAPSSSLNRRNWRRWVDFIREAYPASLNEYEMKVLPDIVRQSGISDRQGGVIWRALRRLHPAGCGKWGRPTPCA